MTDLQSVSGQDCNFTLTAVQNDHVNLSLAPEMIYPSPVFLPRPNCGADKVPAFGIKAWGN